MELKKSKAEKTYEDRLVNLRLAFNSVFPGVNSTNDCVSEAAKVECQDKLELVFDAVLNLARSVCNAHTSDAIQNIFAQRIQDCDGDVVVYVDQGSKDFSAASIVLADGSVHAFSTNRREHRDSHFFKKNISDSRQMRIFDELGVRNFSDLYLLLTDKDMLGEKFSSVWFEALSEQDPLIYEVRKVVADALDMSGWQVEHLLVALKGLLKKTSVPRRPSEDVYLDEMEHQLGVFSRNGDVDWEDRAKVVDFGSCSVESDEKQFEMEAEVRAALLTMLVEGAYVHKDGVDIKKSFERKFWKSEDGKEVFFVLGDSVYCVPNSLHDVVDYMKDKLGFDVPEYLNEHGVSQSSRVELFLTLLGFAEWDDGQISEDGEDERRSFERLCADVDLIRADLLPSLYERAIRYLGNDGAFPISDLLRRYIYKNELYGRVDGEPHLYLYKAIDGGDKIVFANMFNGFVVNRVFLSEDRGKARAFREREYKNFLAHGRVSEGERMFLEREFPGVKTFSELFKVVDGHLANNQSKYRFWEAGKMWAYLKSNYRASSSATDYKMLRYHEQRSCSLDADSKHSF